MAKNERIYVQGMLVVFMQMETTRTFIELPLSVNQIMDMWREALMRTGFSYVKACKLAARMFDERTDALKREVEPKEPPYLRRVWLFSNYYMVKR